MKVCMYYGGRNKSSSIIKAVKERSLVEWSRDLIEEKIIETVESFLIVPLPYIASCIENNKTTDSFFIY